MTNILKIGVLSTSLLILVACTPKSANMISQHSSTAGIHLEKAKAIAFKAAGANESLVTNLTMEQDVYMAQAVYEIDFDYQGQEYSYSISVADGSILEQSNEPSDAQVVGGLTASSVASSDKLTHEQAKELAFKDAGVALSAISNVFVTEEMENGQAIYDIEFISAGTEYSYNLNAYTGDILAKEQEALHD